jgi:hypothetical protein
MKLYILFIVGLFVYEASYAQNMFPSTGNVGLGTVSPVANLDIYSTANTQIAPLISIRSNFHVAGNYGMIRFGDYTQTTAYQKGALIYESMAGSARGKFHIALENTDGVGSVSLRDAKLTVLSNGNVGIGTMIPDAELAVKGTIHTQQVRVDMNGWADYIFEKSYQLPSLSAVESYIDRNHHLPDMPSEKEVIELGKMVRLQTKKIEELTLYLIEQQKEIKSLKLRVQNCKKK